MNLLEFLNKHGTAAVHEIAKAIASDYVYLRQIAYGHRQPSPAFAKKLVEASKEIPKPATRPRLTLAALRPDIYG